MTKEMWRILCLMILEALDLAHFQQYKKSILRKAELESLNATNIVFLSSRLNEWNAEAEFKWVKAMIEFDKGMY